MRFNVETKRLVEAAEVELAKETCPQFTRWSQGLIPPINCFVSGQILGPTEEKRSENLSQICEKLNEEKGHQIKLSLIKTEVGAWRRIQGSCYMGLSPQGYPMVKVEFSKFWRYFTESIFILSFSYCKVLMDQN